MFGWGVKTVSVDDLAAAFGSGKPVLIDVREPHEYNAGHVKGAVNVPLGQLAGRVGDFDPSATTYVICQSGRRSVTGAKILKKAGFTHAYSVAGGTSAWQGKLIR